MVSGNVNGGVIPDSNTGAKTGNRPASWLPSRAEIITWSLILAVGLVISRGLFQPGTILSGDNAVHQAEISALKEIVLAEQSWWSGWYEGDFAGYPLLVYQYPLGKWLVALLSFLPGLSLETAYKWFVFLSWLFPALVTVRMLGRRGYSLLTLLTVSAFYLACFDAFLLSLAGMWNQYLSAGLFLIAVDCILKMLNSGCIRQVAIAALWTSVAAVSHQFMLVLLPVVWLTVMSHTVRRRGVFSRETCFLLLLPFLSLLLSAWYFLPIFATWDWPGFVVSPMDWYNLCSSLFPIVSSDLLRTEGFSSCGNPRIFLYSLGMIAALIWGFSGMAFLVSGGKKEGNRDPLFITAAGILIGVTGLILLVLWEPVPFFRSFTLSVGGGRLALYLLLPLMLLSALSLEPLPGNRPAGIKRKMLCLLPLLLLIPNLAWASVSRSFPLPEILYIEGEGDRRTEEMKGLDRVFAWLKAHGVPGEGRVLFQDTAYNFRNHQLFWSHALARGRGETGLWSLGSSGQLFVPTDPLTRTQGISIFGKIRSEMTPEELGEKLKLFNCRWALSCEPELESLLRSCDSVEPVISEGRFTLFRTLGELNWAEIVEGEGEVRTIRQTDSRRIMEAEILSPAGALIMVKSSYHPWWRASLNGDDIPAERGQPDQLLRVKIPGEGRFQINLEFRPPRLLPVFLTFIGLMAGAAMVIPWKRKLP